MRHRLAIPLLLFPACVVVAAFGCSLERSQRVSPPDEPRYCTLRYEIDDGGVAVCASLPLESADLRRLERQLDEVRALYPRFASACGVPLEGMPPSLTLHVIRYEELNDRVAFPRDERVGNILGRYFVGRQTVFVTERALHDDGLIHLPHELAHWLQDHAGVEDADEDERLARAFHRLYRSHVSDLRSPSRAVAMDFAPPPSRLARVDKESPPARDRSLAERTDGPIPLIADLCR